MRTARGSELHAPKTEVFMSDNQNVAPEQAKKEVREFYRRETEIRDSEEWLARGGTARVPESKSAHYFVDRKVSAALRMSGLPSSAEVIEVGCSFGQMSFLLAEKFRRVTAVDLSPDTVDLASRRAERYNVRNLDFRIADAENLADIPDNTYDGAFSFSVLRYVPNPDAALREIHRVLKSGGTAVVDFPNKYCPWFGPLKKIIGIKPHVHDRLFSAGEVMRMMREAGFRDVRCKHMLFTTRRLPVKLLPIFRVLDRVLEPIPLVNRMAAIIMVTGRKP